MNAQTNVASPDLKRAWLDLRHTEPQLRWRDAAARLAVSELELLAAFCGDGVTRLATDGKALLALLPSLGSVMALTRNEHAVIEKVGRYEGVDVDTGLVLGDPIDLRLFLQHWRHAFAVDAVADTGLRPSIQVFDASGTAVHKVYLTESSDAAAFAALVAAHRSADQQRHVAVEPPAAVPPERPDADVDGAGLRTAWLALQDTHEFIGLLQRFAVSRLQAMRLAGPELAQPVDPLSLRLVLEQAARSALPIMVFVGNRGAIEIHTGAVHRVHVKGPWLNVLDDEFNLHIVETAIDTAWVVRKPTVDGIVTALELFDARGDTIALVFGKRKPGMPESPEWRVLADNLPLYTT